MRGNGVLSAVSESSLSLRERNRASAATKPLMILVGRENAGRGEFTYPIECATSTTPTSLSSGGHGFSRCVFRMSMTRSFSLRAISSGAQYLPVYPSALLTIPERPGWPAPALLWSHRWDRRRFRRARWAVREQLVASGPGTWSDLTIRPARPRSQTRTYIGKVAKCVVVTLERGALVSRDQLGWPFTRLTLNP